MVWLSGGAKLISLPILSSESTPPLFASEKQKKKKKKKSAMIEGRYCHTP